MITITRLFGRRQRASRKGIAHEVASDVLIAAMRTGVTQVSHAAIRQAAIAVAATAVGLSVRTVSLDGHDIDPSPSGRAVDADVPDGLDVALVGPHIEMVVSGKAPLDITRHPGLVATGVFCHRYYGAIEEVAGAMVRRGSVTGGEVAAAIDRHYATRSH
jgi:hypothetical protein